MRFQKWIELCLLAIITLQLFEGSAASSQETNANNSSRELSFEVASIRPAKANDPAQGVRRSPGRFSIENMCVRDIIKLAYGIRTARQIEGAPHWIDSARFDIEAKIPDEIVAEMKHSPAEPNEPLLMEMLRSLLKDRFQLRLMETQKRLPILELDVISKGPKFSVVERSDREEIDDAVGIYPGRIVATHTSMHTLARLISDLPEAADKVVIDRTNLQGKYDFVLEWKPFGSDSGGNLNPPEPANLPGLFVAVKEQLGLALNSKRDLVPILSIEAIEEPSAN